MSMVTPQTRSLLSAAISAADHGYFEDAQLLLRDALDAEYATEIALAIDSIERRAADCLSLDLRPELRSLFANAHPISPVESSSVTPIAQRPTVGEDFWSEIVIDFDETEDAGHADGRGKTPLFSEVVESVVPKQDEPHIEPPPLERHASARARYVAASPAPPPPSHRRATSAPSTEHGLPRGEDAPSSRSEQQSDAPFNTLRRPSSSSISTIAPDNRSAADASDDSMGWLDQNVVPTTSPSSTLEKVTPRAGATPIGSTGVGREAGQLDPSLIYQASERDTVMVDAVVDSAADDSGGVAHHIDMVIPPATSSAGNLEPILSSPPTDGRAATSPVFEPSPISGSIAIPSAPSAGYVSESEGLSGSMPDSQDRHEPEFQAEERSARFRVTSSRSTNKQAPVERTHRHIHSGIDASDSPPPTREVLGGTLAPRPVDLKAELQMLGRRILKRNLKNIQAARASLTPRTMFLLDQIDGQSSVEDIIDVTGLPTQEAYTLIKQLVDKGLVYLD
ncbi:MAG: hypothetical protein KGO50_12535 [Myxococcales bacterium]|nr:hypothetical protein [Myxococcales bacterium]